MRISMNMILIMTQSVEVCCKCLTCFRIVWKTNQTMVNEYDHLEQQDLPIQGSPCFYNGTLPSHVPKGNLQGKS